MHAGFFIVVDRCIKRLECEVLRRWRIGETGDIGQKQLRRYDEIMKSAAAILLISFLAIADLAGAGQLESPPPVSLMDRQELAAAADRPLEALLRAPEPQVAEVLIYAMSMIGVKYRYGGNSRDSGFDCSGFVRHVFATTAAINLPRVASAMSKLGHDVLLEELAPGDLVFYNTLGRRFSHVGIYIGGNNFVHSPSVGKSVEVVDMNNRYWKRRFNGARRLLDAEPPSGDNLNSARSTQ